jgi:hypothetical protein
MTHGKLQKIGTTIVFTLGLILLPELGWAQTFVPVTSNLPILNSGSGRWGDYDSDGDLDLLVSGREVGSSAQITAIFRNDGGTLTDIGAGLVDLYGGVLDWGDYDNDGDLDFVVSGWDAGNNIRTFIYRNDDNGTFVDINAGVIGVTSGEADWGDYDNDGDLDLLILGGADFPELETTRIYRNDGNDVFVESGIALQDMDRGSVAWGDYDNDGDLDILLTGRLSDPPLLTLLYRNDGNGTFTLIDAGLQDLYDGQGRWADYDQDGDLDIFVNGSNAFGTAFDSFVYRNDGNDTFTDINATLDPAGEGASMSPGDCDNDGDLDVVMVGVFDGPPDVYRYEGDSVFVPINAGIDACCGTTTWGDYDNDGDLDLVTVVFFSDHVLYRNDLTPANTPPLPPMGLAATVHDDSVTLSWHPGSDNETAAAGLTYNIRVGTTSGGSEIVAGMADPATGYRKIVDFGNVFQNTSWTIAGLPEKTYFWSVQSIDNNFAGSAPAAEQTFTIGPQVCDCTAHGDIVGDSFIDVLDLGALIEYVFQGADAPASDPQCPHINRTDVNCDGFASVLDMVRLIDHIFRSGPGPCDPCICSPYPDACP